MTTIKNHRGISLDFWTDENVVDLSPLARLLFIGSWHYACDTSGHLDASPKELRMKVLPADAADGVALVEEIVAAGLMTRDDDGRLTIPHLPEHQRVDKRYKTRCERCPEDHAASPEETPAPLTSARGDHAGTTRALKGTHAEGEGEGEGEGEVTPTGGPGGEPPKPRKRGAGKGTTSKGTRLPEIFPISPAMAEWGREHAPNVDARREHEVFCDYWRGQSGQKGVKADWIATWRNWMRRAQERIDERNGHSPTKAADAGLPDWMLA